jgi:hypothetical protein
MDVAGESESVVRAIVPIVDWPERRSTRKRRATQGGPSFERFDAVAT